MKSIVIALPQPPRNTEREVRPIQERLASFFRQYGMMLFFVIVLLSGFVCGAVRSVSGGSPDVSGLHGFLLTLPEKSPKTPVMFFADSFSVSFVFTAALCFLALTPAGLPGIPALIFFRGYEFGVFSGVLCTAYGFSGLAYFVSVVLAGAFLSSIALVYLSQYSVGCSFSMLLAIAGHTTGAFTLRERFKELLINGAYALMIVVFSSLTDTLLYFLIGRLFAFSF